MSVPLQPAVNDLNAPFWAASAQGRLALPHCLTSNRAFWPPSPTSPFVTGGDVDWRDVSPEGRLLSMVVYRRPFLAELSQQLPYGIALVELADDVRIFVHVRDPDGADMPAIGQGVSLSFRPLVEGGVAIAMLD
jgi:uncharacterized protein